MTSTTTQGPQIDKACSTNLSPLYWVLLPASRRILAVGSGVSRHRRKAMSESSLGYEADYEATKWNWCAMTIQE